MILKIIPQPYNESQCVYNLMKYIMKDKSFTDRYERNTYSGSPNIYDINRAADEFMMIKDCYGKRGGRQLRHIVIAPEPKDLFTAGMLYELALYVCEYYSDRYQICYSVHTDKRNLHLHIVMNSVSYIDGRMLHDTLKEQAQFRKYCEECYKRIKAQYAWVKPQLKSF